MLYFGWNLSGVILITFWSDITFPWPIDCMQNSQHLFDPRANSSAIENQDDLPSQSQWVQINFSTLNQLSSTILNVDIWLRNRWFCNNDQPKINFSTRIQPKINQNWSWNIDVEKWLKFGWQLVDFRLRNWFLVDHCYKINDFSTKYQCWYLVEKLICAHRVISPWSYF